MADLGMPFIDLGSVLDLGILVRRGAGVTLEADYMYSEVSDTHMHTHTHIHTHTHAHTHTHTHNTHTTHTHTHTHTHTQDPCSICFDTMKAGQKLCK